MITCALNEIQDDLISQRVWGVTCSLPNFTLLLLFFGPDSDHTWHIPIYHHYLLTDRLSIRRYHAYWGIPV